MKDKKAEEIRLDVKGMTCESCATHVRTALQRIDGVKAVDIPSWRDGYARVVVEGDVPDRDLEETVEKAGYRAKVQSRNVTSLDMALPLAPKKSGYDLAVIGTGSAGVAAAIRAAEAGYKVALIEQGVVGGTCVNIGCVPSKTLIRAAGAYHMARAHPFSGITTSAESVTWSEVVRQKNELVAQLRKEKYADVISHYSERISLLHGHARITKDGKVIIDDNNEIHPSRIIIATGARPRILQVEGVDGTDVLTSTTVMDLDELPQSLIVIGGRSIALELGQMLSRLGVDVTILQRSKTIIPDHEPEIAKALTDYLQDEGMQIVTGVSILSITGGERKTVTVRTADDSRAEYHAQQVLMAVGRVPNTDGMGLDEAGVELDGGFVKVDSQLRTSNPMIYAAGDVTTLPKFVYVAAAAGGIAAENALEGTSKEIDLSSMPAIIFTSPQVATVGMTESEAREAGLEVSISILPLKYVPRALAAHDIRGVIKLVADKKSNTLLGAHILAEEAGEMIQTAALAIHMGRKHGFTIEDFRKMLFPYLVQVEGLKLAALGFEKDVSKLSCCAG